MVDDYNKSFIDDSGIYDNSKTRQTKIFVGVCHFLSILLGIIGILALIKGNI